MSEIAAISNSRPVSPPSPPVAPESHAAPVAAEKPKPAPKPEQSFEMHGYTARYRMDGDRLNIQILNAKGQLVRTVPPNELLKALQGEFSSASINVHG
jgi:membrane-bound inhibitor of C-type lysozyme